MWVPLANPPGYKDLQVLAQSLYQPPTRPPPNPSSFLYYLLKPSAQEPMGPLTSFKATNKWESGVCEVPRQESMEKMLRPKSHMLSFGGGKEITPLGGNCHL